MLTSEVAKLNVSRVFDMLNNPEDMLEVCLRPDSSQLYKAMIPHLRNYGKDGKGRQVMFTAAVGSINYDCITSNSDLDVKAVYLPSVRDLYFGRDTKFSFVTDDFDCELHSMVNFRNHVLKGNMNFFEPVLTDIRSVNPFMRNVIDNLGKLVKMNVGKTVLATYFTAYQMDKGVDYVDLNNPEKNYKKQAHAIRLLLFLLDLFDTGGGFHLAPRYLADRMLVIDLKMGNSSDYEYKDMYDEMKENVKSLAFKSMDDKGNFEFSDLVLDLDGTDTTEWYDLIREVDEKLIKEIK